MDDEKENSPLWGFNPESRRFVLRSGTTWGRLVRRNVVEDAALQAQWAAAKEKLRQDQIERARSARALGIGIAGGAQAKAASGLAPPTASQDREAPRDILRTLALENREALSRDDISRAEAESILRRAYASRLRPGAGPKIQEPPVARPPVEQPSDDAEPADPPISRGQAPLPLAPIRIVMRAGPRGRRA